MSKSTFDNDFGVAVSSKPAAATDETSREHSDETFLLRWIVLHPALACAALLAIVSALFAIKPFWSSDRLDNPVQVAQVTPQTLNLADGRKIALPFIKVIPASHPVFVAAVKNGVEVSPDGTVYGLLKIQPTCGMTAYRYHIQRTNLSQLAGVLNQDGIDESVVPRDSLATLRNGIYVPEDPEKVRDYLRVSLKSTADAFLSAGTR